ncbi:GNAT family N-acetyltransferase [Hydrogenophaga sp. 5NK40-0174]|uniref:bifunctional acetate--CoA ligase family protein/GNAT family N-acetyltransferase n=1 Tax=Hydrogenophaga sp. 5NK40-0174 TaxID=3127649 RepID=UPI00310C4D90
MSTRHLDLLFSPQSIVVLGASARHGSVGGTVWRNLSGGLFQGRLYPVNPKHTSLSGLKCYANVDKLPEAPDLAVICTPPKTVPGLIADLGKRGTKAAIVVSAGLDKQQKQAMLDEARQHTLRILGPNCIGMLAPHHGVNASFAHIGAKPGSLAFVSQSGALVTAMLDWAASRGIGFSHFVSLGERADVDFGDMLDYLAHDPKTRAVLLYIESIEESRKFMSAARAAARNKPVIVVKAGRSAAGQHAAASHTGALAGADDVFDAAIARAGMLRVDTLHDLFLAAETLSRFRDGPSDGLLVLTNGGGAGVMAADAASAAGVPLPDLDDDLLKQLDAVLPPNWSRANPIDIIGDAPAQRYCDAMAALQSSTEHAVLFIHAPTAIVPSPDIARALLPAVASPEPSTDAGPWRPIPDNKSTPSAPPIASDIPTQRGPMGGRVLGCWLGDRAVQSARELFRAGGVADFDTPEEAVRAFAFLRTYRLHQEELLQTPATQHATKPVDKDRIRSLIQGALKDKRRWLTEAEAKQLLEAAGLPVVPTRVVGTDAEEAVNAAEAMHYPVALKILSPEITHKSDVGGVKLHIGNAQELEQACKAMLERVKQERPDATIEGFTVQPMVQMKHAHELIVGTSVDPVFGPVILFGAGGTAVEVLADRALALPPLNHVLARAQIERTRIAKLLKGYRDEPAADMAGIEQVLVSISQLMADVPEVAELDINPLLVNHEGVVALDARVRVSADCPGGAGHFAIKPYPQSLVEAWEHNGATYVLRPIRPEDEAQHRVFLEQMDPEDIRMRIFYSRRTIEHTELAQLTQIDYAREMAFVLTRPTADGKAEETLGAVRARVDADNHTAEFGVLVRSDLKGQGFGHKLMQKLIEYLRGQGTQELAGTVLRENRGMLALARSLGFAISSPSSGQSSEHEDAREVVLRLQAD